MILRYPSYYKRFSCIAQRCEDTCCAGWEIDIDDRSYQYYMSVEGEFGERLRRSIREYRPEDQDVYESHGFILGESSFSVLSLRVDRVTTSSYFVLICFPPPLLFPILPALYRFLQTTLQNKYWGIDQPDHTLIKTP